MGKQTAPRLTVPDPLAAFAEELFAHLPRVDQRRWAAAYLHGLLATEGKKTLRRLGEAIGAPPTAWQSLHQFVNVSPWPWNPARRALLAWALRRGAPEGWAIRSVVIPKRGDRSVGVQRRAVPGTGETVNCQLAVALFARLSGVLVPVDWRLDLPGRWSEDDDSCRTARVPDSARFLSVEDHVLQLAGTARRHGSPGGPPLLIDLPELTDLTWLLHRLPGHGAGSVIRVPDRQLPAVRSLGGERRHRLVREPVEGGAGRTWLADRALKERELRSVLGGFTERTRAADPKGFGLLDFEGRSFPGWHRHVTMVSAACAFAQQVAPARARRLWLTSVS